MINLKELSIEKLKEYASNENSEVVVVSAKMESELSELNDDDKSPLLPSGFLSYNKMLIKKYSLMCRKKWHKIVQNTQFPKKMI